MLVELPQPTIIITFELHVTYTYLYSLSYAKNKLVPVLIFRWWAHECYYQTEPKCNNWSSMKAKMRNTSPVEFTKRSDWWYTPLNLWTIENNVTFKLVNQVRTINDTNSWICRCDKHFWWTSRCKLLYKN